MNNKKHGGRLWKASKRPVRAVQGTGLRDARHESVVHCDIDTGPYSKQAGTE